MKIYLESYGCTANKDNANIIEGILSQHHIFVSNPKEADIIILNTCTVKHTTEQKMVSRIRKYKSKKLIIAGCMATIQKELLQKEAPNASIINTHNITKIEQAINKQIILTKQRKEVKLSLPKSKNNIIQILQGCKGNCNFCITRLEKGRLYSYPKSKIIQEFKKAITKNKVIYLTSQDNACYGLDKNHHSQLPELLNEILKIKGNYKIRIGMMNPTHTLPILKELITVYKDQKIIKFLHIPVQSGSNKVLKEMNRFHSVEDFKKIVKLFRKAIPDITISTDIIVGYPTETELDFQQTLKLLKQIKPEVLNISRFTSRPHTLAAKLKQLSTEIKKQRSRISANLLKNNYQD